MEILNITTFVLLTLLAAAGTGWLAKQIGKNYRLWFWLSIPMPAIAICILICLPEESQKSKSNPVAKEKKQLRDTFFINEDSKSINVYEPDISATA